jgi:hypothetical protein
MADWTTEGSEGPNFMSGEPKSLGQTVKAMRPMVPAKDFEISKRFYIELGFQPRPLTDRLVEMQLGVFSFILQAYYVRPQCYFALPSGPLRSSGWALRAC